VEIEFHRLVRRDVLEILRYYQAVSNRIADKFRSELNAKIIQAAENPFRFPAVDRSFRPANLTRFPYHVLYELRGDRLRVMIVRHHKRHPKLGLGRQ
jgi:plasmid stabilization system protein ParE